MQSCTVAMTCPKCGLTAEVPKEYAGKTGRCTQCGEAIIVETQDTCSGGKTVVSKKKWGCLALLGLFLLLVILSSVLNKRDGIYALLDKHGYVSISGYVPDHISFSGGFDENRYRITIYPPDGSSRDNPGLTMSIDKELLRAGRQITDSDWHDFKTTLIGLSIASPVKDEELSHDSHLTEWSDVPEVYLKGRVWIDSEDKSTDFTTANSSSVNFDVEGSAAAVRYEYSKVVRKRVDPFVIKLKIPLSELEYNQLNKYVPPQADVPNQSPVQEPSDPNFIQNNTVAWNNATQDQKMYTVKTMIRISDSGGVLKQDVSRNLADPANLDNYAKSVVNCVNTSHEPGKPVAEIIAACMQNLGML